MKGVGRLSFPNSCLGTLVAETPVSGLRETGVSQADVPKQEFGNEKPSRVIFSECSKSLPKFPYYLGVGGDE
jgi:hypothetical protein